MIHIRIIFGYPYPILIRNFHTFSIHPYPNTTLAQYKTKTPFHLCDPIHNNNITCCVLTIGIKAW